MANNRDLAWGALVVLTGVGGFLLGQERPFSPSPEEVAAEYADIQQRIREVLAEDTTVPASVSGRQEKDPSEMTDAELDRAIGET